MAEQLKIEIDVSAARAALEALGKTFTQFQTTANASVGQASSSVNRLNDAMRKIKAIDGSVLNSLTQLNQAFANLNPGSLNGLVGALDALAGKGAGVQATAAAVKATADALQQVKTPEGIERMSISFGRAGAALKDANAHVKDFEKNNTAMAKAAAAAAQQQARANAATAQSIRQMGVELVNTLGYQMGLTVSLGNMLNGFKNLQTGITSVTGVLREWVGAFGPLGATAAVIGGVVLAFGALKAVAQGLIKPIIDVGYAFEAFKNVVDSIDGAGAGAQQLDALKKVAQTAALDINVLTKTYTAFRAAAASANVSVEASLKIFSDYSMALRAMGADSVKTEKAFLALTQMFSKGKVQAEELRGQLGDALPGAFSYAAQAMGKTTAQLDAMLKAGTVLATDLVPKLGEFLRVEFGNAIAKNAETATAALTRFGNAITYLLEAMYSGNFGGVAAGIAAGMSAITRAISGEAIMAFARTIGDLIGLLSGSFLSVIAGVAKGFAMVFDTIVKFVTMLKNSITAVQQFFDSMSGSYKILGFVGAAFEQIGTVVGVGLGVWAAYSIGVKVATAASLVYTAVTARLTQAQTALAAATATANTASRANPWVALASVIALVVVGVLEATGAFGSLASVMGSTGDEAEKAKTKMDGFADTSSVLKEAVKGFNDEASKSPQSIMATVQSLYSLETAQSQAAQKVRELDDALKNNKQSQQDNSEQMNKAERQHSAYIRSIEAEIQAIEREKTAMQSRKTALDAVSSSLGGSAKSNNAMGSSIDYTARKMQGMDSQIRALRESIQDSNLSFADAKDRAAEYGRSLDSSADSIERQKALIEQYGVALSASGVQMAKQLETWGKTSKEAGSLIGQYELLMQSESKRADQLKQSMMQDEEQIKLFSRLADEMKKKVDAQEAARTKTGESAKVLEEEFKASRKLIGAFQEQAAASLKQKMAKEAYLLVLTKGQTMEQAASATAQKYKDQLNGQATASTIAADATKIFTDELGKTGSAANTAADGLKKTAEFSNFAKTAWEGLMSIGGGIGAIFSGIGTALMNLVNSWSLNTDAINQTSTSMETMKTATSDMAVKVPMLNAGLSGMNGALSAMQQTLPTTAVGFTNLATESAKMSSPLTIIATAFQTIGGILPALLEPFQKFAEKFAVFSSASEGIDKTRIAFAALLTAMTDAGEAMEKASNNLAGINASVEHIKTGMDDGIASIGRYEDALTSLRDGLDPLIAKLNAVASAARNALAAVQAANRAGGGGSAGQREGGFSEENFVKSSSLTMKDLKGAPQFAEGTANTSKHSSKLPGGGIPSILHPNEAVIPLSKGRTVPVSLDYENLPKMQAPQMTDMSGVERSMTDVAGALRDVARALGQQQMPDITMPALPEVQVEQSRVPSAAEIDNRASSGVGFSPDGLTTRGTPNGSIASDSSQPDKAGGITNNINITIQASDLDSFKRSEDQIARQLAKKISQAQRRVS